MKVLTLFLVIIALLCIPASLVARQDKTIRSTSEEDTWSGTARVDHSAQPYIDHGKAQWRYLYRGSVTQTTTTYRVNCGTALVENSPPIYTQVSRVQHKEGIKGQSYFEDSATEALQDAASNVGKADDFSYDPATAKQHALRVCHSDIVEQRWLTFFASPVGWIVILVALALCAGIAAGGDLIEIIIFWR